MDLGEIHQAAVTTNTGAALVVSGRGSARSSGGTTWPWGSWPRNASAARRGHDGRASLQAARRKVSARKRRQIRDLRHKGTQKVIAFCQPQGWGASSSGIRMGCATAGADGITISVWSMGIRSGYRLPFL